LFVFMVVFLHESMPSRAFLVFCGFLVKKRISVMLFCLMFGNVAIFFNNPAPTAVPLALCLLPHLDYATLPFRHFLTFDTRWRSHFSPLRLRVPRPFVTVSKCQRRAGPDMWVVGGILHFSILRSSEKFRFLAFLRAAWRPLPPEVLTQHIVLQCSAVNRERFLSSTPPAPITPRSHLQCAFSLILLPCLLDAMLRLVVIHLDASVFCPPVGTRSHIRPPRQVRDDL